MGTNILNPFEIFGAAAPSNILLTNLLSYYNFDESSGNLLDIHGSEDFALTDAPTQGVSGLINDAYDFNGSSNYCTSLNNTPWDLQTTDFSISFWFTIGSNSTNLFMLDYRDGSNDGFRVARIANNRLEVKHNSITFTSSATYLTSATFRHFILSADRDSTSTIYINGSSIGTINTSSNLNILVKAFLGSRSFSTPTNRHNGLLDESGIWNRALTSDEVALLYNSGAGLSYTSFG